MPPEDWTTSDGLRDIARTRAARIDGWRAPAAFGVGYRTADSGDWIFPHVNNPDAPSALSAVLLAETIGYVSGTAEFPMTIRQLDRAIGRLAPAAAAPALRHANLQAWRDIAAVRPAEIVAVFVGDPTDPPAGPADAALRRLL